MAKKRYGKSNLDILREIDAGKHPTQTKTTIGFSDVDKIRELVLKQKQDLGRKREIGETWIEDTPAGKIKCTQQDGYVTRIKEDVSAFSDGLRDIREFLNSLSNCSDPKCQTKQYSRADKKAIIRTKLCVSCLAAKEDILRATGKFHEYEVEKMQKNALSFFKDSDDYINEVVKELQNGRTVLGEGGTEEKIPPTPELAAAILYDYLEFKADALKQLEEGTYNE